MKKTKPIAVMGTGEHKGKQYIVIVCLNTKRMKKVGFGYFFHKIKPGELIVNKAVLKTIKQGGFLRGICPMEIFDGNTIGFCEQWIDPNKLSVHSTSAKKWFEKCSVVQSDEEVDKLLNWKFEE